MKDLFHEAGATLVSTLESGVVVPAAQLQAQLDTFAFVCSQVGEEDIAAAAYTIKTIHDHASANPALNVPPLPTPGQGQMG